MTAHEILAQLQKMEGGPSGLIECSHVHSEYLAWFDFADEKGVAIRITVLDAGPEAQPNRYAVVARSRDNRRRTGGNHMASIAEALAVVRWQKLKERRHSAVEASRP